MVPVRSLALSGLLLLAACATPEERCIRDATRELRTVNALIAETEANLARGYTYRTEQDYRRGLTFCAGRYHRVGVSFCTSDYLVNRDVPEAVDPASERRKLETLRARQRVLQAGSGPVIAACQTR